MELRSTLTDDDFFNRAERHFCVPARDSSIHQGQPAHSANEHEQDKDHMWDCAECGSDPERQTDSSDCWRAFEQACADREIISDADNERSR